MGAFVKKWFHLVLIFVFAYLAGSLAGHAANQFSSAEDLPKMLFMNLPKSQWL